MSIGYHFLVVEESHRVLRNLTLGYLCPVRICNLVAFVIQILEISTYTIVHLIVYTNRLCWIHGQRITDGIAKIGIAVLFEHILRCEVEVQVLVEEGRSQIDRSVETLHPAGFNDTVVVFET